MGARINQLMQIYNHTTWDGDLISKEDRDKLVGSHLVARAHGYNVITGDGIKVLLDLDLIRMGIRDYDGNVPSGQEQKLEGKFTADVPSGDGLTECRIEGHIDIDLGGGKRFTIKEELVRNDQTEGQNKTWYGIGVDNPLLAQLDELGVVKRRHPLNWSWDERARARQQIAEQLYLYWCQGVGAGEDPFNDLKGDDKQEYEADANKILDLLGI